MQVHELVEKAEVVRPGWNGYNIMHDSAARVAALDIGFLPSASASQAPPAKVVLLLGSDDYREEDIPQGAFVIYMVRDPYGQLSLLCIRSVDPGLQVLAQDLLGLLCHAHGAVSC